MKYALVPYSLSKELDLGIFLPGEFESRNEMLHVKVSDRNH